MGRGFFKNRAGILPPPHVLDFWGKNWVSGGASFHSIVQSHAPGVPD